MSTTDSTPEPAHAARWPRWMLLAGTTATAMVLLVSAWLSFGGVREASRTLARGQGDALLDELHRRFAALQRPPEQAELDRLRAELAPRGLTFVAIAEPGREVASGEARGGALPDRRRGPPGPPPASRAIELDDRLRLVEPLPHGPALLAIELEPSEANRLAATATRNLLVAGLAAALLVLGGGLGFLRMVRHERGAAARARERHLASLGEMSAVLAHELRNPLASLKGNAQLLAESLDGDDRGRADLVVREAVRLEELTRGLLALVRTGTIERRDVEPAAVVRAAVDDVRAGGASVALAVDDAAAPARWSLDGERFRQVVANVVRNAVEASPPGATVDVALTGGDALRVVVRDRGPGIPPGDEARIFQAFHTRKLRGTGLGLAVARRVVELHGGTIRARNHEDGGAVVEIVVPR